MCRKLLLLLSLVHCTFASYSWTGFTDVQTTKGTLKGGQYKGHSNKTVSAFLGVPYARPPLGPRRFRPPEEALPWSGVRNATSFESVCMQPPPVIPAGLAASEDCLYLNIFIPGNLSEAGKVNRNLPVMIWIHHGGFQIGVGYNEGSILAEVQDIIVVNFDHRLGVFGFLSFENPAAPGNAGVLDQQAAMRWVRDNIEKFGGDPNNVTLTGLSAGGGATSLHLLSPTSKGLFQKAITMSGSSLGDHVLDTNARGKALQFSAALGCNRPTDAEKVACLQNIDTNRLFGTSLGWLQRGDEFHPISGDSIFLPGNPRDMLDKGDIIKGVSIMSGVTVFESWLSFGAQVMNITNRDTFLQFVTKNANLKNPDATIPSLLATYTPFGNEQNISLWQRAALNVLTDRLYVAGTVQILDAMVDAGNAAYMYLFTHRPSRSMLDDPSKRPPWVSSSHTDDFGFALGEMWEDAADPAERQLSATMMEAFGNFVKTGNPGLTVAGQPWLQYTTQNKRYLKFNTQMTGASFDENPWPTRMAFWNSVVAQLEQEPQKETGPTDAPVVTCSDGTVKGHSASYNGFKWEEFFGLPYAKTPVGNLRFRAPESHPGWSGVRDGTAYRERCYTDPTAPVPKLRPEIHGKVETFSEDCLFLNIFVPGSIAEAKKSPKAVMVWIHGGGFSLGDTVTYDPSVFTPYNDVILVTVAYRLGPLGFLSTLNSHAPGNYGLLDQQMALRWVHSNIISFGGDPNRVTIFGESAGAASVSFQVLNPISRMYFQRAISFSGSAFDPWALDNMITKKASNEFTHSLGCSDMDKGTMMDCLRKVDVNVLQNKTVYDLAITKRFIWLPVVDGVMVKDDPRKLIEAGEGSTVEYMMGTNNEELLGQTEPAVLIGMRLLSDPSKVNMTALYHYAFEQVVGLEYMSNNPAVVKAAEIEYFLGINDTPGDSILAFSRLLTDFMFTSGTAFNARELKKNMAKIFVFEFTHSSLIPALTAGLNYKFVTEGAQHGDDILYTFGTPLDERYRHRVFDFEFRPQDRRMADIFMRLITNFAKTGNPSTDSVTWPPYELGDQQYLEIKPDPEVKSHYRPRSSALWNDVAPALLQANPQCLP